MRFNEKIGFVHFFSCKVKRSAFVMKMYYNIKDCE